MIHDKITNVKITPASLFYLAKLEYLFIKEYNGYKTEHLNRIFTFKVELS